LKLPKQNDILKNKPSVFKGKLKKRKPDIESLAKKPLNQGMFSAKGRR